MFKRCCINCKLFWECKDYKIKDVCYKFKYDNSIKFLIFVFVINIMALIYRIYLLLEV